MWAYYIIFYRTFNYIIHIILQSNLMTNSGFERLTGLGLYIFNKICYHTTLKILKEHYYLNEKKK